MSRLDNLNYTVHIGDQLWCYNSVNSNWTYRLAARVAHYNVNDILGRQQLSAKQKRKWPTFDSIGDFVFLKLPAEAHPYSIIAIRCDPVSNSAEWRSLYDVHPDSAYGQGYV